MGRATGRRHVTCEPLGGGVAHSGDRLAPPPSDLGFPLRCVTVWLDRHGFALSWGVTTRTADYEVEEIAAGGCGRMVTPFEAFDRALSSSQEQLDLFSS